jgi:hypothetical protein
MTFVFRIHRFQGDIALVPQGQPFHFALTLARSLSTPLIDVLVKMLYSNLLKTGEIPDNSASEPQKRNSFHIIRGIGRQTENLSEKSPFRREKRNVIQLITS